MGLKIMNDKGDVIAQSFLQTSQETARETVKWIQEHVAQAYFPSQDGMS